ncbi:unnamed protein product [Cunninghamella echinulata]
MTSNSSTIWFKNMIGDLNDLKLITDKDVRWIISGVLKNLENKLVIMDTLKKEDEEMLAIWEYEIYHSLLLNTESFKAARTTTKLKTDIYSLWTYGDDDFYDRVEYYDERILNETNNQDKNQAYVYQKYVNHVAAIEWINRMIYTTSKQFIKDDQDYWLPWRKKSFITTLPLPLPLFTRQQSKDLDQYKEWNMCDKTKYLPMLDVPPILNKFNKDNHLLTFTKESRLILNEDVKKNLLELNQHFCKKQIFGKIDDPINLYLPSIELKPKALTQKLYNISLDGNVPQQSFNNNANMSITSSSPPPSPDSYQQESLSPIESFTPSIINSHSYDEFKKPVMIKKKMTNTTDAIIRNQFTFISPPFLPPPPLQQELSSSIPLTIKNKSQYWPLKNQNEDNNNISDNSTAPIPSIRSSSSIVSLTKPMLTSTSLTSASKNKKSNFKLLSDKSSISMQSSSLLTPYLVQPSINENNKNKNTTYLLSEGMGDDSDSISFDSVLLKYVHEHDENDTNTKNNNSSSLSSLFTLPNNDYFPNYNLKANSNSSPILPQINKGATRVSSNLISTKTVNTVKLHQYQQNKSFVPITSKTNAVPDFQFSFSPSKNLNDFLNIRQFPSSSSSHSISSPFAKKSSLNQTADEDNDKCELDDPIFY